MIERSSRGRSKQNYTFENFVRSTNNARVANSATAHLMILSVILQMILLVIDGYRGS